MLAWFGCVAGIIAITLLLMRAASGNHLLVPVAIFVLFWIVGAGSFFGLAISANRLAKELGVSLRGIPLPLVYATGLGTFFSVWLDKKAKQASGQSSV